MNVVAHTTPYAWPFDKAIDPLRLALIVCGAGDGWAARTPLDNTVDARIDRLRTCAQRVGAMVILLDEAGPRTRGVAPLPAPASPVLAPRSNESVISAAGADGFYGSALDARLHQAGVSHLVLAGRGFETCVHSTLRRANDRGYECLTIADACASIDPTNRAAAVSTIEMSGGIFGAVGTTEHICSALETLIDPPPPHNLETS